MKEVLILGNGISRLLHEDLIKGWHGELWACNYAYLEWGHKLTRLTGHIDVLFEAIEHRDRNQHSYEIWTGDIWRFPEDTQKLKKVSCKPEFCKDSGTTLIAQALTDGFERILLCGFDLGGRDIYTVNLYQHNKSSWVERVRAIRKAFPVAFEGVEFVGYDHMPFIAGNADRKAYYKRYIAGQPHIPDPAYIALYNLLYGTREVYGYRRYSIVKVRYIKGPRAGWETEYKEALAKILAERGEIEIIGVTREEKPEEPEIAGDTTITDRMKKDTIVKIAKLRGIEDAEGHTKAELIELLRETGGGA